MKAIWKGQLLAESNDTIVIEGNHYFPEESVDKEFFQESETNTVCPWKGTASYFDVTVNGDINSNAAWYYPLASQRAKEIEGRIAFWKGVEITK